MHTSETPMGPPLVAESNAVRASTAREGEPVRRSTPGEGGGSQSRIPGILFWILGAALVLRVLTALTDRGRPDAGGGLVRWQPHESAAAAARTTAKPVLYDFTAAWCAPCHRLDSEGWQDSQIAATVNDGFVPARVEDRQREEGSNPRSIEELQRRYSVNAFPTLIVTDASGGELARMEGYSGKNRLSEFLQTAKQKSQRH